MILIRALRHRDSVKLVETAYLFLEKVVGSKPETRDDSTNDKKTVDVCQLVKVELYHAEGKMRL